MEAALVQQMVGQDTAHTDPDAVIVAAMLAGSANAYASLQRYAAAAERSYYKANKSWSGNAPAPRSLPPSPLFSPYKTNPNPPPLRPLTSSITSSPTPISLICRNSEPSAGRIAQIAARPLRSLHLKIKKVRRGEPPHSRS